jgi:hypothetical protein
MLCRGEESLSLRARLFGRGALASLPQSDIKTESPPSVGTRGDSRGATQVNAIETKIPVVMQQGGKSQRHSFQIRHIACGVWLYPCSITGAPELGYSFWSRYGLHPTRPPSFALLTRRSIRLLRFCLACTTFHSALWKSL